MFAIEDLIFWRSQKDFSKGADSIELNFFMHNSCKGLSPFVCDGINHYELKYGTWSISLKLLLVSKCDGSCRSSWAQDRAIPCADRQRAERVYHRKIKI